MEAVTSEKSDEKVLEFFDGQILAIQKLPEQKQIEICQLARDLISFSSLNRRLTADERDTIAWIGQQISKGSVDQLASIVEAKSLSEIGGNITGGNVELPYEEVLSDALPFNWKRSFEAFENLCVLGEEAVRKGVIPLQATSFTNRHLKLICDNDKPAESFAVSLAITNSKKLEPIYECPKFTDKLSKRLATERFMSPKVTLTEYLADVQGQIELKDLDARIGIPILSETFNPVPTETKEEFFAWSTTSQAALQYPVLSKQCEAVLSVSLGRRKAMDPKLQKYFEDQMQKKHDRDIGTRLMIGEMLCDDLSSPPETLVKASLEALIEGWKLNEPVPQSTASEILEKFRNTKRKGGVNWPELERELGNEFHRRFVARENLTKSGMLRALTPDSEFNRSFIKEMIHLKVEQKDFLAANQILNRYRTTLEPDLGNLFALMVREGGHETASRILRTGWRQCLKRPPYQYRFDQAQADGLAELQKSLALGDSVDAGGRGIVDCITIRPADFERQTRRMGDKIGTTGGYCKRIPN